MASVPLERNPLYKNAVKWEFPLILIYEIVPGEGQ